jgi:hypothetical protein
VTTRVHVYRINLARLIVMPIIWLAFVVLMFVLAVMSDKPDDSAAGQAIILMLTLIMAPIFYVGVWRSRLEVSAEGIAHYQFGYSIHSTWQNLERISLEPAAEGLFLREPGTTSTILRASTRIVQSVSQAVGMPSFLGDYDTMAAGRFIALTTFTSHLHGGPLSADLERWAPQLFQR